MGLQMPKLVQVYIRAVLIGFGLAAIFVAALIWLDVAQLGRLLLGSDVGLVAVLALWALNGIVFAGVQFGWVIMRLGREVPPGGGARLRIWKPAPAAVHRRAR